MHFRPFSICLTSGLLAEATVNQFSSPGRLTGTSFGVSNRNATYDYVIIGGGLAGSVIAARLVENSNASVAVVEAGNFYEYTNGNYSQIPFWSEQGAGSSLSTDNVPGVDWSLLTEPQVNGERLHYAQGKALGGSSSRNQMLYHRGTKGFYQAWADHVGDQSYAWDNMIPYLKRSMTFTGPRAEIEGGNATIEIDRSAFLPYHNASNPLQVSYIPYIEELSTYAPAAFSNIGMVEQAGHSSGVLNGYGTWTYTINPHTGTRSSAQSSFLNEALNSKQLTVYPQTLVQNVIFNANKTAVGVNVTSIGIDRSDARYFNLTARKEVLLSAGAWHSPQILMLSGIGPKATLKKFDIPVVSDLQGVGQNMWDTTNVGGVVHPINASFTTMGSIENNETLLMEAEHQFLKSGTGPLTNIGTDFVAWYKIPHNITSSFSNATQQHLSSFPADWPEIEYSLASSSRSLEASTSAMKLGSINSLMIATASRGNMTIRSNSIYDRPIVNPNWLLEKEDQEVAIAAYRQAREAWKGVPPGVIAGPEMFPGANVTSDADLLTAIMGNLAPIHHASASCAMGKIGDPATVVDSKGRVVGVKGLRVVDSSSFPFTNPGHTQGTTYGHAERMAAEVLRDC